MKRQLFLKFENKEILKSYKNKKKIMCTLDLSDIDTNTHANNVSIIRVKCV